MRPRTSWALKGSRLAIPAANLTRYSVPSSCATHALADWRMHARLYENSGKIRTTDRTLAMKKPRPRKKSDSERFAEGVGRGLRMAARRARRIARMYGTPIYVWENGEVVAKKP